MCCFLLAGCLMAPSARGQREMEDLDRGLVAIRQDGGSVYLSWRLLGGDAEKLGFNLYRVREGRNERVNAEPIIGSTNFLDTAAGKSEAYFVRGVMDEKEGEAEGRSGILEKPFLEIPLQPLEGYDADDASVGDLDGDGRYEIVLHRTSKGRDNSFNGITGTPVLEAYRLDGTFLWRIDLGINIREGQHYTQFIVYDLDGDGRAEIACKTADGTKDGAGKWIGEPGKDWRNKEVGTAKFGRILAGPEFLTIFDGRTGAALRTVNYIPGRDPIDGWGGNGGNGGNDEYGNRCDRFLACVAYLDGKRPSLVMCRGVYGRTVIAAWDWRGGELSSRWVFDSGIARPPYEGVSPFSGMGGHALAVTDVDADGKDEIVYQGMTVDHDGKGLYSTGRRHGDSLHVSDFDPARPGLELYLVSENEDDTMRFQTPGAGLHDAATGKILWSHSPGVDFGRGIVADIDARHAGAEVWGGPTPLRTIRGEVIGAPPALADWVIWWDGDLLRELYGGFSVFKWRAEEEKTALVFAAEPPFPQTRRLRYAGMRPNISADILGDWREEFVAVGPGGKSLRLYITTIPTSHRLTTLMHDPQYRLSVAWQNVAYNKPANTSYYLGDGMKPPVRPKIAFAKRYSPARPKTAAAF
jgi:rhamnogalacturonan endolyase